ncbi:MAG: hypothetical protein L0332_18495 [Chloroflexi bacterium]|nr:hypothetical protein [Chloroflexota bacterium]MCI0580216.1 hypothetical protein [Chloroflexota bacterium]MCI0646933.1 hypothetical protein [Chloroflexota bacterium]MCI0728688.1 hypothetical protein [Chloroflexota bacterium]
MALSPHPPGSFHLDGIIFVAAGDQADSLNFLLSEDMPVVLVDRDLPNVEVDAVLTDGHFCLK